METDRIEASAREALRRFAHAALGVCAAIGTEAFGNEKARDGAVEVARKADDVLGRDMVGHLVSAFDADGLTIGNTHVSTQLAAFAQGEAASPIDSVWVDSVKEIALPTLETRLGTIETSCKLTVRVTCGRQTEVRKQPVTTTTEVELTLVCTSPERSLSGLA